MSEYRNVYLLTIGNLFISLFSLFGQDNSVGIGQWRSHLSYENMIAIAESKTAVFYASSEAVLKVNKEDQSLEHLNKVVGLSDMGISAIEYFQEEDLLIIAYRNGNIDLMDEHGYVRNLSAIKNNSSIVGNKSVQHIFCANRQIYFSCPFGMTIYDLELAAFKETVFTPSITVNATSRLVDTLFISTNAGIYRNELGLGVNLSDFNTWKKEDLDQGIFSTNYRSNALINIQNQLYADINDTLMYYKNGRWNHITHTTSTGQVLNYWKPNPVNVDYVYNFNFSTNYNQNQLIIATNTYVYYLIDSQHKIESKTYPRSWRIKDMVIDQENISWAADESYLHRNFQHFKPNSPQHRFVKDMHVDEEGTLWGASSNVINQPLHSPYGFFKYQDGIWTSFNAKTRPEMDTFYDTYVIRSNPKNNTIYLGSYMNGLLKMDKEETISIYDHYQEESPFSRNIIDTLRTRVLGIAVDKDGTVWMTNPCHRSLLVAQKLNGDWKQITSSKFKSIDITSIEIDKNGYKWLQHVNGGVTVFDSGDLENDTDDRAIHLDASNSLLPDGNITTIKADKSGAIWLGTNEGIAIFNCGASVFSEDCEGARPTILQDSFRSYLLGSEHINIIAVDGANRKWIGTNNGLFFLSANGKEQLAYFNVDNSPLFGNTITSLAVDGISGTVYIGTKSGIQSYRGTGTRGEKRMKKSDVTVFPHPIEPDYSGPIAISNLADEANVKITDISGRLVYETVALGGQAIWEGTSYDGRKVQSGVYLVFIVNKEGTQEGVCKILFMN